MSEMKKITLKELLNKYFLIIPDYQREYAQGRDNDRDRNVLDMFINTIATSLQNDKELNFDLIYGNIRNKNGVDVFFPVDGQQRLTTLFLFYVYCYQIDDEKNFLNKFRYEVHPETTQFMQLLIKNGAHEPEEAKDWKTWFEIMSSIHNDPCSVSLFRAYRAIENRLRKENRKKYIENLEKISFQVLEAKDCDQKYSLPDSIFWKMNARGKQLTSAEIFKAAYYGDDKDAKDFDDFAVKLFDQLKNNYEAFDNTLIYIVNIIFEGFSIISGNSDKNAEIDFINTPYVSKDEYKKFKEKYDTEIKGIFKYLGNAFSFDNFIKNLPKYRRKKANIYESLTSQKLSKDMRILFFSYLFAKSYDKNQDEIKRKVRICSNLIRNMDSEAALRTIYAKDLCKTPDILLSLSDDINDKNSSFQYQEECEKAVAIKNKSVGESEIVKAEKISFADGAIRYLFMDFENEPNWNNFRNKKENFKKYFNSGSRENQKTVLSAFINCSEVHDLENKFLYQEGEELSYLFRDILLNKHYVEFSHYLLLDNIAVLEEKINKLDSPSDLTVKRQLIAFLYLTEKLTEKTKADKSIRYKWYFWYNWFPFIYPKNNSGSYWYPIDGWSVKDKDEKNYYCAMNNELYVVLTSKKDVQPCYYEQNKSKTIYYFLKHVKLRTKDGFVIAYDMNNKISGYRGDTFYFEYLNHFYALSYNYKERYPIISYIGKKEENGSFLLNYEDIWNGDMKIDTTMRIPINCDEAHITSLLEKKAEEILNAISNSMM